MQDGSFPLTPQVCFVFKKKKICLEDGKQPEFKKTLKLPVLKHSLNLRNIIVAPLVELPVCSRLGPTPPMAPNRQMSQSAPRKVMSPAPGSPGGSGKTGSRVSSDISTPLHTASVQEEKPSGTFASRREAGLGSSGGK